MGTPAVAKYSLSFGGSAWQIPAPFVELLHLAHPSCDMAKASVPFRVHMRM